MLRRCFAITMACLLTIGSAGTTLYAKSLDDLKQEKKDVESEKSGIQQELDATKQQKSKTMQEMDEYDQLLNQITEEIEYIESELALSEVLLEETGVELEAAETARDEQYEVFKQRARYMYINGKMSYVDIIFKAESFSDMMKRFDTVNRIVKYDTEMVQRLQEAEEEVALKVSQIQKQKDDLEALQYTQTQKKNSYEGIRLEKVALLAKLNDEIEEHEKTMADLEAQDKKIEDMIKQHMGEQARIAAANNTTVHYEYDGQPLQWPVPGRSKTSSEFVNRTNPITGRREFHTGLDIPAPYGTGIVAAEAGTVIYSGWQSGYGNTIMIDHGNGMVTLYGHNSSLVSRVGEKVSRGQVVAKCGSTGMSTGNHCHFEVRMYGTAVNPRQYVKA